MFLVRIIKLAWREMRLLCSDVRQLTIVLIMPAVYTLMLGYLYWNKRVSDIPTHIVDQDNSALSRSLVQAVEVNDSFHIVNYDSTEAKFREATQRDQAFACIIIPRHFERDVKRGRAVKLIALVDGSNLLLSNTLARGVATVGGTYAAGVQVKRLNMRGTPGRQTLDAITPIEANSRVLYNPGYSYSDFVLPGLVGAVVQQITLLGVALAFARERREGLLLDAMKITKSPLEVLAAKGIFYTALNMGTAMLAFGMLFTLFDVPIAGPMLPVMLLTGLFIFAIVALGICVSAVARDELFATEFLMLVSLPSFLLSGFTWPQFSMVKGILFLSNLFPLTHFVMPLRAVLVMGADMSVIRGQLLWLFWLAVGSYAIAYVIIRREMRKTAAAARAEKKGAPYAKEGGSVSLELSS